MTSRVKLIAAVGSSFAAGPGIEPIADKGAMRSGANYAHLLADRLGAAIVDLSVSGATTATILDQQQRMLARRFEPQLSGLPADADVVTVTAGGNDLKYASSMLAAAVGSRLESRVATRLFAPLLRRNDPPRPSAEDISRTAAGLTSIATAIKAGAPHARIFLVDYLTVVAPYTRAGEDAPFTDDEMTTFSAMQSAIREAFLRAAGESGVELLGASELSANHGLGSAEPWVFGYRGPKNLGSSFHPNPAGMRAIADALYERVTND